MESEKRRLKADRRVCLARGRTRGPRAARHMGRPPLVNRNNLARGPTGLATSPPSDPATLHALLHRVPVQYAISRFAIFSFEHVYYAGESSIMCTDHRANKSIEYKQSFFL